MIDAAVINRFWKHVDAPSAEACWVWRGSRRGKYGSFSLKNRSVLAHRLVMSACLNRTLSSKEFICHHCDNPPCVNPSHLFVGDFRANYADSRAKKRNAAGVRQGIASFNESDLQVVRDLYLAGLNCTVIADRFGVHKTTVARVIKGVTYAQGQAQAPIVLKRRVRIRSVARCAECGTMVTVRVDGSLRAHGFRAAGGDGRKFSVLETKCSGRAEEIDG